MSDTPRLIEAAAFAAEAHRDQRRKGQSMTPYINHPLAVAAVLSVEAGVTDRDILLAALLHDTVEDTRTSFDDLTSAFGRVVSDLVREVSDDKSLPKAERKRLQIEKAATASHSAKQVKIADKICNIRDVTIDPPSDWSEERRREYVEWSVSVVEGCRGANPSLEAIFDAAVSAAFARLSE